MRTISYAAAVTEALAEEKKWEEALDAIKQSFPLRSPPESLLDEKGKLSIRFSFHYFPSSSG